MPAVLTINGESIPAGPGQTIFECAERLGVRIPTSCNKQGKCRECLVEVTAGAEFLSPRTDRERHLSGAFPIVVPDGDRRGRRGPVPHDAARAHADRTGRRVGGGRGRVTRGRTGSRRISGPRPSCSGCTISASGELVADAAFENPQRFGGSEIMSRIQYDHEHPGRLLMRTLAGYLSHAIEDFPVRGEDIREMVVVGNSTMRDLFFRAERVVHRAEPVPIDHGVARLDRPDEHRGAVAAADSSAGAGLRRADRQRARRSGRGGVHARGGPGAREAAGRGHGHRDEHGDRPRESGPGYRGVLPGGSGVRRRGDRVRHAGARRGHPGCGDRGRWVVPAGRDRGRRAAGDLRVGAGRFDERAACGRSG